MAGTCNWGKQLTDIADIRCSWSSTVDEGKGSIIEPIQVLPGTWDHETNGVILVIWCHFNRSKHIDILSISCRITLPEHTGAD